MIKIKHLVTKSISLGAVLFFVVALLLPLSRAHAATTIAITSPTSGSTATGTSFTVTGTATAKRSISVAVNGTTVGTTTSDNSGNWSLNVTGQAVGAKTITATASVGYAYVANSGDATISVINTVTDEKIGSNISSSVNQSVLAVNPNGTQMVTISGFGANAIKVWSLANPEVPVITNSLTATGGHAMKVLYSPNGTYFYVTSEAADFSGGTVTRYNSADPTTSAAVTGYNQNLPADISFSSDSSRVYVGNVISSTISVINVATNTQLSTFASAGAGGPLKSDNIHGYSVDTSNDVAYPYNVQSASTGSSISVGDAPIGSAFNQDQSQLLVANSIGNSISVINTSSNTVTNTVSTGASSAPNGIAFTNNFAKVYVVENGLDRVSVRDPSTLASTSTITVGDAPSFVAMGPNQTATTTVSFTLAADAVLANTGSNAKAVEYGAIAAVIVGTVGLTYRLRHRPKSKYR